MRKIAIFLLGLLLSITVILPWNSYAASNSQVKGSAIEKQSSIKKASSAKLKLRKKIAFKLLDDQLVRQQKMKLKNKTNQNKSITATALTEQTYSGQIDVYTLNVYRFSTDGGTVNVQNLAQSENVDYAISRYNGSDLNGDYKSGDTLPAGTYYFVVFAATDSPVNYSYKINGISLTDAPNDLPGFSLTSPSQRFLVMQRGATSLNVTGVSTSNYLEYISTMSDGYVSISPTSSFNFDISLSDGYNNLMFHAISSSGNEIYSSYAQVIPSLSRLGGDDRYEVSANVYREVSKMFTTDTIIVASGEIYNDALSGTPLAYVNGAPLLLTSMNSLPSSTQTVVNEIKPTHAIILGGTGSVSTNVETQLQNLGVTTIERISGANRFEVSANIAERLGHIDSETALIVSGLVYSDALTASSPAASHGMPLLQVETNSIPTSIQNYINNHPEITKFVIVGGSGTVSDTVKTQLSQLRPGATIDRVDGVNRYEVGINVIDYFDMNVDFLTFNNGTDFPDAMSSGPLAAYLGSAILLTDPNTLPTNINSFLDQHYGQIFFIYIIGGPASVSTTVENELSTKIP